MSECQLERESLQSCHQTDQCFESDAEFKSILRPHEPPALQTPPPPARRRAGSGFSPRRRAGSGRRELSLAEGELAAEPNRISLGQLGRCARNRISSGQLVRQTHVSQRQTLRARCPSQMCVQNLPAQDGLIPLRCEKRCSFVPQGAGVVWQIQVWSYMIIYVMCLKARSRKYAARGQEGKHR